MQNAKLNAVLKEVASRYPEELVKAQMRDVPRISFNIGVALDSIKQKPPSELGICDIGGGLGLFSVGCAAYGFKRAVLVDDFDDPVNHRIGSSILSLHRSFGVEVVSRDVIEQGISDIPGTFDIVTSFDSMEHWHNSPRRLFREVVQKLNMGGVFVLGVPNCVNMRKRITVPFGVGKWSAMKDWYEEEKFRAHVREPDVGDLWYIANDMGLRNVRIYGRNWQGYYSLNSLTRFATRVVDFSLRVKPSLCSDIYLVGTKSSDPK